MSKVYYSKGDNIKDLTPKNVDENDQIPSVEYVKSAIKSLTDELNDKIGDLGDGINYPIATLDTIGKNAHTEDDDDPSVSKVKAEDVLTDAKHMFITQSQLDSFKAKPTMQELNMVFGTVTEDIQQMVDTAYVNIMNTPNALQKLKDLSYLIRDNIDMKNILDLCASKVDDADFQAHKDSVVHMTSNDRSALNILLKMVDTGFADWNATPDDQNYIKNKPTSFPADGGNADTLGGKSPETYLTSRTEDCVIGYNADDCDIVVDNNTKDIAEVFNRKADEDNSLSYHGLTVIQSGLYYAESDVTLHSAKYDTIGSFIVSGNYTSTVLDFKGNTLTIDKASVLKDVMIKNAKVTIKDNAELNNVYFKDCDVKFNACSKTIMKYCTFEGSSFKYMGIIQNSMVLFNRGKGVNFNYSGDNNVIMGNQSY